MTGAPQPREATSSPASPTPSSRRPDAAAARRTDAVAFFADWLGARAARSNRAGMRALLYALELAPLAAGAGARLRRLDGARRRAALERIDAPPRSAAPSTPSTAIAQLSYYGDDAVMRSLGYDADAVVARGPRAARRGGRRVS